MLQSEWKTKLLLVCFCQPFQAGNFQAGRQADLSEREPSIVTHFTRPHVLYPRASKMTVAVLVVLVRPENLSMSVSVFVCVHM